MHLFEFEIEGRNHFIDLRENELRVLETEDTFLVNNRKYFSRLLHCFGDSGTSIDLSTILELLKKSGTQFLTVNTHNIKKAQNKNALFIGYTNISLDDISKLIDISEYTILNNT